MTNTEKNAWISGFWRRLGALLIDSIVLGVVGFGLGLVLGGYFVQVGVWGRLIGFCIAMVYFGVMNSQIANGQTLGKKALKLMVVDSSNQPISLIRSFGRYSILGAPFFLNGANFSDAVMFSFWIYPLSVVIFGGMFAIIYLYIFNRATRQSLHDLIFHTYVVNVQLEKTNIAPFWKPHLLVISVVFLAAAIVPAFTSKLVQADPFADLLKSRSALLFNEHVSSVTVVSGKNITSTAGSGTHESSYVSAQVWLKANEVENAALAKELAKSLVHSYPKSIQKDFIVINLLYGYDIGIASKWSSHSHSFAPSELLEAEASTK